MAMDSNPEADTLSGRISALVRDCEAYRRDRSADRLDAMRFYDGDPDTVPYEEDRSKIVSRDVRAGIRKVLPSIVRVLTGGDEVVEYQPVGQGDEKTAQQASDYVNYVVLPESGGRDAIHDAVHDALKLRNGILRMWIDTKADAKVSRHTGLDEMSMAVLVNDPDIEVLEQSIDDGPTPADGGDGMEAFGPTYSLKIKRIVRANQIRVAAVPPERFLIHPDATCIEDAIMVGVHERIRRSDLVAMGYDLEQIKELPEVGGHESFDAEEIEREDYTLRNREADSDWQNSEVDYWELYARVDVDGDGIAELRRYCYAGAIKDEYLLDEEEADMVPFFDLVCERQPHQWEGVSIADDLIEIQTVKTVLLRNTLDNIYWQNNLQPVMRDNAITNPEAVFNPKFGLPIVVKNGVSVQDAIHWNPVPFVGEAAFKMLEYFDSAAQDRTGISDASSGMAQDALQNMTAKASAMMEAAGIGQTELMISTLAGGLRKFFKGLLRLVIQHQDKPRTVRLRDDWVEFDPRQWDAEMDASVNVGLGAGTRERDMMMMQHVMLIQEKLLAGFGPDNPFVKPENVHNAVKKLIEAAGLKSPALYITEPNPQEVEQKLQAIRNQPNPEQMKIQAQMELEKAKMASNRDKESAQMQADLTVKQADIEARSRDQADKLAADAALNEQKLQVERERMASDREIALLKMAQERDMKAMELQHQREIEMARMEAQGRAAERQAAERAVEWSLRSSENDTKAELAREKAAGDVD